VLYLVVVLISCSDYYPEYECCEGDILGIECDYCKSDQLEFSWRRKFVIDEHGWSGTHEYWYCSNCGGGAFIVKRG